MSLFDSVGSLAGGVFGGLLGGLGGGSKPAGSTTVTNTASQDIPDWLKPYVTGNLNSAQSVVKNLNPSALTNFATPEIASTINGDYLNSNPYLDQIYQHGAGLIGQNVDSRFESAGRYGSGSHASSLAEPLAGLYGNLYGNNYQQERNRQATTALNAPAFATGSVNAALAPYTGLSNLIPNLRNTSGTTTTPYFTNPFGQAAGGALLGSQLFGGGPSISSMFSGLGGMGGLEGGAGYAGLLGGSAAAGAGVGGMSLADMLSAGLIAV